MKIYTKTGDDGTSSLFSGERVKKNHPRLQAYGTLDELNSYLGLLISQLDKFTDIQNQLWEIQSDLLYFGGWIATSPDSENIKRLKPITQDKISFLENAINVMQNSIPPINTFILPGGDFSAALAHVARTICRRAEREIIQFYQQSTNSLYHENIEKSVIYLNRLSDYLYILARFINHLNNFPEKEWK
jgi:cob(I)alamin adenosyltransferase